MTSSWKTLSTLSVLAAALLHLAPQAIAQSVWTGSGTDDNWSDATNWGGTAPTSGAALQFAGSTQTTTNNDFTAGTAFTSITFNAGASSFTLGGNAIAFNTAGTVIKNSSSNNQTVNLGINLTATSGDIQLDSGTGLTLTLNGVISFGSDRLYDAVGNAGTIVLNGANTGLGNSNTFYQTTSTVMRNTVYNATANMTYVVGNANAFGASSATGLQMNQNTYLQSNTNLSGANALVNSIAIGGGRTLTINGSNNLTIAGNLFDSNNSTSGNTLAVTNTGITTISGSVYLSSGGNARTMTFNVSTTLALSGAIQNADSADTTTTGAEVGSLTKTGSGTLSLSGTNTYTGTTTISSGTLSIGGSGTLGSGSYAGNISNSATFTYASSTAQTLSGVISGTGALIQSGTGTLTLSGANTYTGSTTIGAGSTIALTGAGSLASASYVIGAGATFNVAGLTTPGYSLANVTTTLGVSGGTNGTINIGAGTLTLGNALTLNFTSSISTGTFNLYSASSVSGDFTSVTASGLLSGSLALASGTWSGTLNGYNLSLVESTGALTVSASAIPEPSTYAAILGTIGLAFATWYRRRTD